MILINVLKYVCFKNFDLFFMKPSILYQLACPQWRFNVDSLHYF